MEIKDYGVKTCLALDYDVLIIVEQELEWGLLCVMGLLTLVPAILFTALCSKYLIRGLTLGAVRG